MKIQLSMASFLALFTSIFTSIFTVAAFAHSDEYLDAIAGPHGGQLRMAGAYHYELVVKPTALQVYVTDHANTAIPAQGATGSADVVNGKNKQNIALKFKNDNLLEAAGNFVISEPTRAVVKIQLPGKDPQQVSFDTSKHKPAAAHHGH